jgi:hypothetical protein
MNIDLLNLPFAIQVSLGSGYAGYLIAFSGLRQHHTPTDVIFRTLSFGLVASAVMTLLSKELAQVGSAVIAFFATVIVGAIWRAFVGRLAKRLIRKLLISWSDDLPNAWLSITAERTDLRPSQIVVELNDGRLLMCDNTRLFARAPFEMGVFGLDGSIALYVTSEMRANGEWIDKEGVLHDHEGANITYVSSSNIKRVELRHWQEKKRKKLPRWLRRGRWWLRRWRR